MLLRDNLFTGEIVRLVAVDPEKAGPLWAIWRQNSEFARLLDMDPTVLHSGRATKEWIEKHLEDWLRYEFTIQTVDGARDIGFVGLEGNIETHADAFVGIGIGETEFWGKGCGTEAMRLILQYAFCELNLHRVSLDVFEYNTRAIASYQKAGFKVEGRMRRAVLRNGRRWDILYMGILREEWLKSLEKTDEGV